MWPDMFELWAETSSPYVYAKTRDRLVHYPILEAASFQLAKNGTAAALAIASDRRQVPGAFPDRGGFLRWFGVVAYRETLRRALDHPSVARWIRELPPPDRSVMRWVYVDQLSDRELAVVLGMPQNVPTARRRAIDTHKRFCQLLSSNRLARDDWTFPMFPAAVAGFPEKERGRVL